MFRTSRILSVGAALAFAGSLACSSSSSPLLTGLYDRGPAVEEGGAASVPLWNARARALIVKNAPNQQAALRAMAYLSKAQYDVARQIPNRHAISMRVAIARASADVLAYVWSGDREALDALVRAETQDAGIDGETPLAIESGRELGETVAKEIVSLASSDRFDATWTGTVPTDPTLWQSAVNRAPLLPALGQMRTFFIASGSVFRPGPPPAVGSEAFKAAVAEVRAFSDTRTPEQQRIAEFWAMGSGQLVAGYWNEQAVQIAMNANFNELRMARMLALMNEAAMDANIACHDAKYTYWVMRPTQADPAIKLAIPLPNHPSYTSNHSCLSTTVADVVGTFVPSQKQQLAAQAAEASLSRLWAGLHYRFDTDAGTEIAHKVSAVAIEKERMLHGDF